MFDGLLVSTGWLSRVALVCAWAASRLASPASRMLQAIFFMAQFVFFFWCGFELNFVFQSTVIFILKSLRFEIEFVFLAVDVNHHDIGPDFHTPDMNTATGCFNIPLVAHGEGVVVDDDQCALGITVETFDGQGTDFNRSEEDTSELQSRQYLLC